MVRKTPLAISGAAGTNAIVLQRLTRETGEPQHLGTNLVSMWYNWTPSSSGQVSFFPDNSLVGIAVYTGTVVSNLTLIAQSTIGSSSTSRPATPRATFTASSGVTYRIALVTYPATRQVTSFWWDQPVSPLIVQDPNPDYVEAVEGFTVTLTAFASGNPTPNFQWQLNGANISGANGTNLTIASMSTNDAGVYRLIASNFWGSVTSAVSTVVYFPSGASPIESSHWTNNAFAFSQAHVVGYQYVVLGTTNLVDWTPLKTNTVPFDFVDDGATNYPYRFYRTEFKP